MKRLLVLAMCVTSILSPALVKAEEIDTEPKESAPSKEKATIKGTLDIVIPLEVPMYAKDIKQANLSLFVNSSQDELAFMLASEDVTNGTHELKDGTQASYQVGVRQEGGKIYSYHITINNLPSDTYTVKLAGVGYSTVSQKVELKDYSKYLTFANDQNFLIGDINDDGQVNDVDYRAVLDAIDTSDAQKLVKYDINRDGKVDIEDLHIVKQNLAVTLVDAKEDITSPMIDPSTIVTSVDQGVKAENISNLFEDTATTASVGFEDVNQKISKENPIQLKLELEEPKFMSKVEITPPASDNGITSGVLIVEDVNGKTIEVPFADKNFFSRSRSSESQAIEIELGKQIAVKKITIKVTGTKKETNLAEIAKVEFINDVYTEMPEKEIAYPKNLKAKAGDESVSLSWDNVTNIDGYQVKYSYIDKKTNKKVEKVVSTSGLTLSVSDLENFTDYTFSVQSVASDNWQSGYGPSVTVTPMPKSKPSAPENLSASGQYKGFIVNWAKTKGATSYSVFYRIKGTTEYKKVTDITSTSYKAMDVENGEYEIYVTASNAHGESGRSESVIAKTIDLEPVGTYNYNLINRSKGTNVPSAHITNVTYPFNSGGYDYEFDKFDIVDNDPTSYWNANSWDTGGFNDLRKGPIFTFDDEYTMKEFAVVPSYNQTNEIGYAKVQYWNKDGKSTLVSASVKKTKDKNGKLYYLVTLPKAIKTNKLQMNLALGYASGGIKISEMKFYEYNSIEDDINGLYPDAMHLSLRDDVNKATLDELSTRLETKDPESDELHPRYASLKQELNYAYDILNAQDKAELFTVDQSINTGNDSHLGFSYPLSDLQPLGIAARANDEFVIYVGSDKDAKYNLELVFTQSAGTATAWKKSVNLNKGKNIITVPDIISTDKEHGGSLYVRYKNKAPSVEQQKKEIKLRVVGGTKIPYVNLSGKTEAEQKAASADYVTQLQTYVEKTLPALYEGKTINNAQKVLNATEIMTDKGLLSLPADTVYKAIQSKGDATAQAQAVYDNGQAIEQLIRMAYTSKGLSDNASDVKDRSPKTRVNIRYATPTDGAFMYAGGNHIGIPYGSTGGLAKGRANTLQSDGTYGGGALYGWGIAHELGHEVDESNMVYGETSNNLVSLLAQTYDGKTTSRIGTKQKEKDIYAKVTSGASGLSGNVFTQLGMFWQLHLYYDQSYITPDNVSSFYAKLYTSYRHNTESTKTQDEKDNLLIRLASSAAGKDLSEYFTKWGLVPNATTKQYMIDNNLPKEEKDIFYINETARKNRLAGMSAMASDTSVMATLRQDKDTHGNDYKSVTIDLGTNKDDDKILGYEIKRNGKVVGFTTDKTFKDSLGSMNNRVFTYEVTAYDYLLNKTETKKLDPIKVKHDGSISKTDWMMSSNAAEDGVVEGESNENDKLKALYNGDYEDMYKGSVSGNAKSLELLIDMNKQQSVSGFKFTAALEDGKVAANTPKKYDIYISNNKADWTKVASGNLKLTVDNPTSVIYFAEGGNVNEGQLGIYDAHYVKVVFNTKTVSLAELDVIAPPGDNVELLNEGSVGILKEDYEYTKGEIIPKGSLVFNGKYRGNPAFNAVLLFNEKDINIADKEGNANSILLAEIPSKGNLYEINDGNWIYWLEPGKFNSENIPTKVKAELYRVDDAATLKGQRLVSDTLYIDVPENLPEISLKNGQGE